MTGETAQVNETLGEEKVREISSRLSEPDWMRDFRMRSLALYRERPLPHRADHLWRYTDPELLEPSGEIAVFSDPSSGALEEAASWPGLAGPLAEGELSGAALALDGRMLRFELSSELQRAGVYLADLATAARERPELLRKVAGNVIGPEFGKFEALNAAAFRGGMFLYVPRRTTASAPIHLLDRIGGIGFLGLRLAVLVEEDCALTLIHEIAGDPPAEAHLSHVGELEIGASSQVQFASIQTLSRRVKAVMTTRARLQRSVIYTPVVASFGGSLAKVDTGAILVGENSESRMTGFVSAVGRQRFDHHTVHHHLGAHTRSDLDFKTVLKGRSRSAYTGLIRIEREAAFSEAYQENRNLLLTEDCRADSIPELEILTEEVECKHGATVGPIDPEHVFYLESRGIPRNEAVRMIVEGHFESTLKRLPQALQGRLRDLLRKRLED